MKGSLSDLQLISIVAIGAVVATAIAFIIFQPVLFAEEQEKLVYARYLTFFTDPTVSSEAAGRVEKGKAAVSVVAAESPFGQNEVMSMKRGDSITINIKLIHAAKAQGYQELTVMTGDNNTASCSSITELPDEIAVCTDNYISYAEKTVTMAANETKTISVEITIPDDLPDDIVNNVLSVPLLFDIVATANKDQYGIALVQGNVGVKIIE